MFDFLFDGKGMIKETKSLLIAVGVIFILIIILKALSKAGMIAPMVKIFGKVISVLFVGAIIVSGVYSLLYLNSYYKREGGIYGQLSSYVYNSIKLVENDNSNETIEYNLDNIVFKKDESDEKYTIVFSQPYENDDYKTKFKEGTKYSIFVQNNEQEYECNNIHYDLEWIHAEYSYVFYNSYQESDVIADDTLTFDFCFYDNYSFLKITSNADETTIQLWNAYFNKFNFKVIIKVVDDVFIPDDTFNESVDEGFVKIIYYIDNEVYKREVFPVSNTEYTLPVREYNGEVLIMSWVDAKENTINTVSLNETCKLRVFAKYRSDVYSVTLKVPDSKRQYITKSTEYYCTGEKYELPYLTLHEPGDMLCWYRSNASNYYMNQGHAETLTMYDEDIEWYAVFYEKILICIYDGEQNGYLVIGMCYVFNGIEMDSKSIADLTFEIPSTYNDGLNGKHPIIGVYSYALKTLKFDSTVNIDGQLSFATYYDAEQSDEQYWFLNYTGNRETHINKIVLPSSITNIYDNAFDGCTDIEYI